MKYRNYKVEKMCYGLAPYIQLANHRNMEDSCCCLVTTYSNFKNLATKLVSSFPPMPKYTPNTCSISAGQLH